MQRTVIAIAAFLFVTPSIVFGASFPRPAGFVVDAAEILSPQDETDLSAKLQAFEASSNHEIAVVTVPNLDGDTIEGYAEQLFEEWGIGKAKADNGVLILVALEEREMRIEVGYGLEGALTDAQSFWIIQNVMIPAFREGNYAAGLQGAVDKVIAATEGEVIPSGSQQNNSSFSKLISDFFYIIPFFFIWFSSILGRSKSWWAGGVVGGVVGIILGAIFGFLYAGVAAIAVLVPLGLLFDYMVSKAYTRGTTTGHIPWWAGGHRRGPWGGGGFGGFGGGRSGGGGSSGRW